MKKPQTTILNDSNIHLKRKCCVCQTPLPQGSWTPGKEYKYKMSKDTETFIVIEDDKGREHQIKSLFGFFRVGKPPKTLERGITLSIITT